MLTSIYPREEENEEENESDQQEVVDSIAYAAGEGEDDGHW